MSASLSITFWGVRGSYPAPGPQTARDCAAVILFQQRGNREAALTRGQNRCSLPPVLPNRGHQVFSPLCSQAVIRRAQAAASAFALMLKTDTPVGALDAAAIVLNADRAEEVERPFPNAGLDIVYAITGFHRRARYAKACQASSARMLVFTSCFANPC